MHKVKTVINYKVPDWEFCNHSSFGKPTKDKCRFCVKSGKGYVCVLHNMPLEVYDGSLIKKECYCLRASAGFHSEVTDEIPVNPSVVIKMAMQEYRKAYKKLLEQGYTDAIADKLAQQSVSK